jgi:hypothetical protein
MESFTRAQRLARAITPLWLWQRIVTTRCPGEDRCDYPGADFHTHHLSAVGRWYYNAI